MHLHGYAFRVVGSGFLNDNLSPDEMRMLDKQGEFPRNFQNATLKDTVCVAHGSYVIVQFVADNPGWWFLHCHLDFHALVSKHCFNKIFKLGIKCIRKGVMVYADMIYTHSHVDKVVSYM